MVLATTNPILSQQIVVKGIYQGENLDILNPFGPNGIGFCVTKVTVNGVETEDAINSSAFEIDLEPYGFKFRDSINIVITHQKGCKPTVLNLYDLRPKSTFKITTMRYDKANNTIHWTTGDERSSLPFIVEQFKWKKWVKVAEIQGKGTVEKHSYFAKVEPHSGKNRFRIKQIDFSKKPRYSQEIIYRSLLPTVSFSPAKPKTVIMFSAVTDYEIYNFYGQRLTKGRGKNIDISKFKKGDYFLNYDNTTTFFHKK